MGKRLCPAEKGLWQPPGDFRRTLAGDVRLGDRLHLRAGAVGVDHLDADADANRRQLEGECPGCQWPRSCERSGCFFADWAQRRLKPDRWADVDPIDQRLWRRYGRRYV